ncbi:hypothetical protein ACWFRB_19130 [Rhodococcus sp. NPDC055112]
MVPKVGEQAVDGGARDPAASQLCAGVGWLGCCRQEALTPSGDDALGRDFLRRFHVHDHDARRRGQGAVFF